jgi:hypothetical protein
MRELSYSPATSSCTCLATLVAFFRRASAAATFKCHLAAQQKVRLGNDKFCAAVFDSKEPSNLNVSEIIVSGAKLIRGD